VAKVPFIMQVIYHGIVNKFSFTLSLWESGVEEIESRGAVVTDLKKHGVLWRSKAGQEASGINVDESNQSEIGRQRENQELVSGIEHTLLLLPPIHAAVEIFNGKGREAFAERSHKAEYIKTAQRAAISAL
jgi:hypothetical protein